MEIKDSGTRRKFESGAVRDIANGKGRCDLLPLSVLSIISQDNIFANLDLYVRTGYAKYLKLIFEQFVKEHYGNFETAILEVSKHYEDGAKKYSDRNWEKGIPLHCYIDSATRHYLKLKRGDKDEPHDRAFLWNILGAWWTYINKPEMIDLPFGEKPDTQLKCKYRRWFGDYAIHTCDKDDSICDNIAKCTKERVV